MDSKQTTANESKEECEWFQTEEHVGCQDGTIKNIINNSRKCTCTHTHQHTHGTLAREYVQRQKPRVLVVVPGGPQCQPPRLPREAARPVATGCDARTAPAEKLTLRPTAAARTGGSEGRARLVSLGRHIDEPSDDTALLRERLGPSLTSFSSLSGAEMRTRFFVVLSSSDSERTARAGTLPVTAAAAAAGGIAIACLAREPEISSSLGDAGDATLGLSTRLLKRVRNGVPARPLVMVPGTGPAAMSTFCRVRDAGESVGVLDCAGGAALTARAMAVRRPCATAASMSSSPGSLPSASVAASATAPSSVRIVLCRSRASRAFLRPSACRRSARARSSAFSAWSARVRYSSRSRASSLSLYSVGRRSVSSALHAVLAASWSLKALSSSSSWSVESSTDSIASSICPARRSSNSRLTRRRATRRSLLVSWAARTAAVRAVRLPKRSSISRRGGARRAGSTGLLPCSSILRCNVLI
eukprot:m.229969 g.229969  ORF g.229969 m.229969 type:complete len:473 (-) comp17879_c0_seq1:1242-2660(-)